MSKEDVPRLLAWLPGLGQIGGMERRDRSLCRVLAACARERGLLLEIVSLRDPAGWRDEHFLERPVSGCGGNRYRFAVSAVASLRHPCALLIVGVVDFGPLVPFARFLRRSTPILTLAHGIEVWERLPPQRRVALHAADRILAVSDYTAGRIASQQGVARACIDVVPPPLDPGLEQEAEAWRNGSRGQPARSSMLSIARMNVIDAPKGVERVIEALPAICDRVPDVDYVVVGDGDDRPRLEQLVERRGLKQRVRFVGRVSDDELHAYLSGADVFVLPSSKEGFGIVFLEAMAHARPVIGGRHGGTPEVVIDGETGLLVSNDDREGLVEAAVRLLADPDERCRMGEAGLQRVRDLYGYESFRCGVEATVAKLLDVSSGSDGQFRRLGRKSLRAREDGASTTPRDCGRRAGRGRCGGLPATGRDHP